MPGKKRAVIKVNVSVDIESSLVQVAILIFSSAFCCARLVCSCAIRE